MIPCRSAHHKAFPSTIQKYKGKLEYSAKKQRKVKKIKKKLNYLQNWNSSLPYQFYNLFLVFYLNLFIVFQIRIRTYI